MADASDACPDAYFTTADRLRARAPPADRTATASPIERHVPRPDAPRPPPAAPPQTSRRPTATATACRTPPTACPDQAGSTATGCPAADPAGAVGRSSSLKRTQKLTALRRAQGAAQVLGRVVGDRRADARQGDGEEARLREEGLQARERQGQLQARRRELAQGHRRAALREAGALARRKMPAVLRLKFTAPARTPSRRSCADVQALSRAQVVPNLTKSLPRMQTQSTLASAASLAADAAAFEAARLVGEVVAAALRGARHRVGRSRSRSPPRDRDRARVGVLLERDPAAAWRGRSRRRSRPLALGVPVAPATVSGSRRRRGSAASVSGGGRRDGLDHRRRLDDRRLLVVVAPAAGERSGRRGTGQDTRAHASSEALSAALCPLRRRPAGRRPRTAPLRPRGPRASTLSSRVSSSRDRGRSARPPPRGRCPRRDGARAISIRIDGAWSRANLLDPA